MDDIIFEKDYRETESAESDKWCDEVFDRAVNCGMLKAYSEAMDKIPKIIEMCIRDSCLTSRLLRIFMEMSLQ